MFNQKNVDYVALLWEDFMFQVDNREISSTRKEHMPYPRFTKVIINHFISKDKTISMRNQINIHTVRNDTLLATPKKARKFKKISSPSKKLSPVLEEETAEKPKRAKKPAKKSTTMPTIGVVIRDTPGVFVTKKKAPAKVNRGKGMDLLSDVALLEAAQLKKTIKKSKLETHKLHASGLGDGGNSEDDDSNDDDNDDVSNDDDDVDTDADGDNKASDSEKTNFDEDENPNLNQNDDEEEYEEEYVRTPDSVNQENMNHVVEESTLYIETSSSRIVSPTLQIPPQPEFCQSPRGIFVNQSKYALEMLKKYGLDQCDFVDIPMVGQSKLHEDPNGNPVDPTRY
ncbi:hypothetical protein Tco_0370843 [Tanacetum coccineum]